MSARYLPYPRWQKPLLQVVMEVKPGSLIGKVKNAEAAISLRELESNPGWKEERSALFNAISILKVLKNVLVQSDTIDG
jgi:hypothetical protein